MLAVLAAQQQTDADAALGLLCLVCFVLAAALVVLLCVVVFILPTLVASVRNHPDLMAILALNFLLGWTFLGWVAAFVWSLVGIRKERT